MPRVPFGDHNGVWLIDGVESFPMIIGHAVGAEPGERSVTLARSPGISINCGVNATAIIDPLNLVIESNESNNTASVFLPLAC